MTSRVLVVLLLAACAKSPPVYPVSVDDLAGLPSCGAPVVVVTAQICDGFFTTAPERLPCAVCTGAGGCATQKGIYCTAGVGCGDARCQHVDEPIQNLTSSGSPTVTLTSKPPVTSNVTITPGPGASCIPCKDHGCGFILPDPNIQVKVAPSAPTHSLPAKAKAGKPRKRT